MFIRYVRLIDFLFYTIYQFWCYRISHFI